MIVFYMINSPANLLLSSLLELLLHVYWRTGQLWFLATSSHKPKRGHCASTSPDAIEQQQFRYPILMGSPYTERNIWSQEREAVSM